MNEKTFFDTLRKALDNAGLVIISPEAIKEIQLAEREQCAQIAEQTKFITCHDEHGEYYVSIPQWARNAIAKAIREYEK